MQLRMAPAAWVPVMGSPWLMPDLAGWSGEWPVMEGKPASISWPMPYWA